MSKASKIIFSVIFVVFSLLIIVGLTLTVIEKETNYTFFINEIVCSFRTPPSLVLCIGICGDSIVALIISIKKKAKRILKIISIIFLILSLLWITLNLLTFSLDRRFYYETSPSGNEEIIICDSQFLIAGFGKVYYRVNPFFILELENEEKKSVEWFYEDYSLEWHDKYVLIDGYSYLLP